MIEAYLFDWGDTLMVDLQGVPGKMCDWETVEAVEGAFELLERLSKQASIYIATGAAESNEIEIEKAFERVNLSQFVSGYFCKANIGVCKGDPSFLPKIIGKLGKPESAVAMVGDSLEKDIYPALKVGIKPIWLSKSNESNLDPAIQIISGLHEFSI